MTSAPRMAAIAAAVLFLGIGTTAVGRAGRYRTERSRSRPGRELPFGVGFGATAERFPCLPKHDEIRATAQSGLVDHSTHLTRVPRAKAWCAIAIVHLYLFFPLPLPCSCS